MAYKMVNNKVVGVMPPTNLSAKEIKKVDNAKRPEKMLLLIQNIQELKKTKKYKVLDVKYCC